MAITSRFLAMHRSLVVLLVLIMSILRSGITASLKAISSNIVDENVQQRRASSRPVRMLSIKIASRQSPADVEAQQRGQYLTRSPSSEHLLTPVIGVPKAPRQSIFEAAFEEDCEAEISRILEEVLSARPNTAPPFDATASQNISSLVDIGTPAAIKTSSLVRNEKASQIAQVTSKASPVYHYSHHVPLQSSQSNARAIHTIHDQTISRPSDSALIHHGQSSQYHPASPAFFSRTIDSAFTSMASSNSKMQPLGELGCQSALARAQKREHIPNILHRRVTRSMSPANPHLMVNPDDADDWHIPRDPERCWKSILAEAYAIHGDKRYQQPKPCNGYIKSADTVKDDQLWKEFVTYNDGDKFYIPRHEFCTPEEVPKIQDMNTWSFDLGYKIADDRKVVEAGKEVENEKEFGDENGLLEDGEDSGNEASDEETEYGAEQDPIGSEVGLKREVENELQDEIEQDLE